MTISGILTAIVIGALLGVVGRAIAPGKQDIPIWLTVIVGIVAALLGTFIVGSLQSTKGLDWVELVVQVVLATIGVIVTARLYPGRNRA